MNCQWCDRTVMWMPRPLDVDYAGFAHTATHRVACAPDTSPATENTHTTTGGD